MSSRLCSLQCGLSLSSLSRDVRYILDEFGTLYMLDHELYVRPVVAQPRMDHSVSLSR